MRPPHLGKPKSQMLPSLEAAKRAGYHVMSTAVLGTADELQDVRLTRSRVRRQRAVALQVARKHHDQEKQ